MFNFGHLGAAPESPNIRN